MKLPGADSSSPATVEDVKHWLNTGRSGRWMMVVDNIDDESILNGPSLELIPQNTNCSVLFTTRNKKLASRLATAHNIIQVAALDSNEAKDLLLDCMGLTELGEKGDADVTELLGCLEYLPLAITQAGSFIFNETSSVSAYLKLYNTSEDEKIRLLSDEESAQVHSSFQGLNSSLKSAPVAVTFMISFEQIQKIDSFAGEILSFMGCLAPQGIPRSLLPSAHDPTCAVKVSKALGLLKAYCLIAADSGDQIFDMHSLVHLAIRNWLRSRNSFDLWIQTSFTSVYQEFPMDPSLDLSNLALCDLYLPHVEAIMSCQCVSLDRGAARARLAHRCSRYLQIKGRYSHAAGFAEDAVKLSKNAFGEDNRETFTKIEAFATVLRNLGQYANARELDENVLHGRIKTSGEDDRELLSSFNNLALDMQGQGHYLEAEEMHRLALDRRKRFFGVEDVETLSSMHNVAYSLQLQEKYRAAEEITEEVVRLKRKVLGPEHIDTLLTVSNLGIVLQEQGHYERAAELHSEVLKGRMKALGENHPLTLQTLNNICCTHFRRGQFGAAEELARYVLKRNCEARGYYHPETLKNRSNLSAALQALGRYDEAEELADENLKAKEMVLGAAHPSTMLSAKNLKELLDIRKVSRIKAPDAKNHSLSPTRQSNTILNPLQELI